MNAHVAKPVNVDLLMTVLGHYVGNSVGNGNVKSAAGG
jgi:hypothetical protein